jgi:homoserine dehydrogenase
MMREIKIGIIGFGTIGAGVAKTLIQNMGLLEERLGFPLTLKKIADIDIAREREIKLPEALLTTDANEIINDPEIDIVVELIGGIEPAKTFITNALKAGKHVVTANKALLASKGKSLFDTAQSCGRDLYFEAADGGGIPIIKTLREALIANNYIFIHGIMNGTCNYILTEMTEKGAGFNDVLKMAQKLGYAEADPTLDIEGHDAAHKLAILCSLAYGTAPDLKGMYVEGISKLDSIDITYAKELGYKVKLLGIAIDRGNKVEARVHPVLIPFSYQLARVDGVFNAFYVKGDIVDTTLFYGRGAGMMPTASAVMSDIADIARNIQSGVAGRIPHLGYRKDQSLKKSFMPIEEISTNYYLRIKVADKPGVLAKIAGILGEKDISILSVIQKPAYEDKFVQVVMMTHEAREADMMEAIRMLSSIKEVGGKPIVLRVEDNSIKKK